MLPKKHQKIQRKCKNNIDRKKRAMYLSRGKTATDTITKHVCIGGKVYEVAVVSGSDKSSIPEGLKPTKRDIEMDVRAKQAVKSAIDNAKKNNIPLGKYDKKRGLAYLEYADGKRVYE